MISEEDPSVADTGDLETDELAARTEVLVEENRRLREQVRRARQTRTDRTALGLAAIGVVALGGAALLPGSREVLLALSGTGLFAAVLVRSLTPERVIAASVGERVYDAHATTGSAVVADLGLSAARVYVPVETGEGATTARLYVPQAAPATPEAIPDLPESDGQRGSFIIAADDRGILWYPTGAGLYRDFERDLVAEPADAPADLAEQVVDALTDGFEMIDAGRADAEPDRLSVAVRGSAYGELDRFDHPVVSFVGVAAAAALDRPVSAETETDDDGRFDAVVTVRWESD